MLITSRKDEEAVYLVPKSARTQFAIKLYFDERMIGNRDMLRRVVTTIQIAGLLSLFGFALGEKAPQSRVSKIAPSENIQFELQSRLIDAVPGDVIELAPGRYQLKHQLTVVTDGLTIRGAGSDKTVLSFKEQATGGAGLEATGNNLLLEGFAVEDTAGNGIKVLGSNGVTFRDVRAEWTGPPSEKNGAYGLYPVQCQNVLMEKCVGIGASDAGLYVGQCTNVIVRNCSAERNVAGIEIENTIAADVYDNVANNNAGGMLVFDLPGLQQTNGRQTRLYRNKFYGNNHKNFAVKGSIVSEVPSGMGVMIMSADDVELFGNEIRGNKTSGISILSYEITGKKLKDKTYDRYPEGISIHGNRFEKNGYKPEGEISLLLRPVIGKRFPDILWDGIANPKKMKDSKLTTEQIPSIKNDGATFANFDYPNFSPQKMLFGKYKVKRDLAAYAIARDRLPAAKLEDTSKLPTKSKRAVEVYRTAKKRLSEYGLFEGALADHQPAARVFQYELNTPLFSDYTTKYRFIRVPEGEQIDYRDKGVLEFPVGTVIAKTFSYPHDMRDPSKGERLLETRIEFREEDNWYGFSYLWNEEQTDATLALGGAEVDVSWIHSDGKRRDNSYRVPNANQCISCHEVGDKYVPIGPVAANMNRDFDYGHGAENQLSHLKANEVLSEMGDLSAVHAWPSSDSGASVDARARTWLHVNCAHCHQPEGTARTSGLDLRKRQSDLAKLGVWKTPIAAGHGTGGHAYDIVPGKPNKSILLHRIKSTDPSVTMPSISKSMVSKEAVELIRDWIAQIKE